MSFQRYIAGTLIYLSLLSTSLAWDYTGHRMVAAVAMDSLPNDYPSFARSESATARVMFLSGEPDRWRNLGDPALRHLNEPDHYCDLEEMELYGLKATNLVELRNELTGLIYVYRSQHPEPVVTNADGYVSEDEAKVHMLFGLLPYSINENFLKLKSEFAYLRDMRNKGASPADMMQARQNVLYTMGILSHFVGDGSQPLHLTKHHHGWVGENPKEYTRNKRFHSWIDGGFIGVSGITFDDMKARVVPARLIWGDDSASYIFSAFPPVMAYLEETHRRVEPVYALEKEGKLDEFKPSPEGRAFIEEQLLRGGQFLGDLYYSAYRSAETMPLSSDYLLTVPSTNAPAVAP